MKTKFHRLGKSAYAIVAFAMTAAVFLPALAGEAFAYGQVTTRSIQMSSAVVSATGVSYKATFTPASSTLIQAIVVDFCSNDPIIGDSCTLPTGFNIGGATPSVTVSAGAISGETGGTWTASGHNNTTGYRTLEIANGSATGTVSGASTFTLTTATNPSTAGTFYARIFTFSSTANATTWLSTANGSDASADVLDAGGIALSTTNTINITAKVQEQITFCVSAIDLTSSTCSSATQPNVTLGSGSPPVLDSSSVDQGSAYTQISTNASTGAVVNMKAGNTCTNTGLSSNGGTTCNITGMDNTSAAAMSAGTTSGNADFGLYVSTGALSTNGVGSTVADANYHNISHVTIPTDLWFGMDNTSNSGGVAGTYGDTIFTTNSQPCSLVNNQLVFAATAALTTPAGIYTGSESLIATGTF